MLNIKPPDYKFCPMCGTTLSIRTHEGHDQKHCASCNWVYYPHVAASSVAVVTKDNKVLLVQRAREPHKGKWMMPAGFLNYGEHPSEAAMREIFEETGYKASTVEFLDVIQVTDDDRPGTEGHLGFFYQVEIDDSIQHDISDKEENSAIEWFDINNLPPIAWENHLNILQTLFR